MCDRVEMAEPRADRGPEAVGVRCQMSRAPVPWGISERQWRQSLATLGQNAV